jgi:hypothetical protein
MTHQLQTTKNISYGDIGSQLFLWQKALTLSPLWALALVPVVGFVFRGMGHAGMQLGYGIVLSCFILYFMQDLLKRRIRLDENYIFCGFKSIPIKNIVSVDVLYKKAKFLPTALTITCLSGNRLKLSLNGLTEQNIETLLRHLQSRNSTLKTAAVLSTLAKCRRIKQKPLETPERLELPYHSRQFIGESIDVFKSTAQKWMRVGPLLTCLLLAPMWMNMLSGLYVSLQPHSWAQLQSLNFHQFLIQVSTAIGTIIFGSAAAVGVGVQRLAQNQLVTFATAAFILSVFAYLQRLFWKPNALIADKNGLKLALRLGEFSLPMAGVRWSEIQGANLYIANGKSGKIRIAKTDGKKFDIDLPALEPIDRGLLLKRMEKLVPSCQIDHELSQSMLPASERSYTELWLQSLNQTPERKTLEPLEPGQTVGENRFEIMRSLGVGGQGTAYMCRPLDRDDTETIVLKETIIPIFADGAVRRIALEKFEQEARLLKSLKYDGIVSLLDYFVEDHRAYLVLEHIDGSTLRELVEREGPLSHDQAQDLALQMCDILTFLHSHSIIHRDFTPDNLILNSKGKLKLIDFNVAQQMQSGTTGTIVGKHAYLPPEQFRGKATTQSDLYAFGATMFFLLTGSDPEPISQSSPAQKNKEVNATLDEIVKHATALQLNKRYQTATEISNELLAADKPAEEQGQTLSTKVSGKVEVSEHG